MRRVAVSACSGWSRLAFEVALLTLLLKAQPAYPAAPHILTDYNGVNVTLRWLSAPGTVYQVQSRTDLNTGEWSNAATVVAPAYISSWTAPVTSQTRFCRLLLPHGTLFEPPERAPAEPSDSGSCGISPASPPHLYLFSGEMHHSAEDLRITGRGLDFVWARKYRSRAGPNTAQGNGWDFSYNIRVERFGLDVVVFDGNARAEQFFRQADGTYAADGFFREGSFSNNVFTLKFADTGRWHFNALNGSVGQGKVSRIEDRNGNALTFSYDAQGRLVTVTDTLNRHITVAYNAQGFIAAVTDFIGRTVRYDYYQTADVGGSFGDLKSMTSPSVTGTPNGNDFLNGKTTTYTYSKASAVEALNHNLLSITDPKGQTWLRNGYASTQDPTDFNFERVLNQTWGNSNEVLTAYYVPQSPASANQNAILKAIVNDRVGNVHEYLYDEANRCVMRRDYTGRAVPGQTTTETLNRPAGRLRTNDPPLFETRYAWSVDFLPTLTTYPNGNSVSNTYELTLNSNSSRRARGNLRARTLLPGPLGGDQLQIIESFEYVSGLGSCCDGNFVTQHTDPRGNVTRHEYDSRGNRTRTTHRIPTIVEDFDYNQFGQIVRNVHPENGSGWRRADAFAYYTEQDGPQYGYLMAKIVDADNKALTSSYEYDRVGNMTRVVDPRGNDALNTYNQLNQIVREASRRAASGVRYVKDRFYDENNNLTRVDVENVDHDGKRPENAFFTVTYDYEVLNRRIRTSSETEAGKNIVVEFGYDQNRNLVRVRHGEAVNGRQTNKVTQVVMDERDRLFRKIAAPGDAAQSTEECDYDGNGNLIHIRQGTESNPTVELLAYDGFDRVVRETDAMSNVTESRYDSNGNMIFEIMRGELVDLPGDTSNIRLSEERNAYDEMDRPLRTEVEYFDTLTQSKLGSGKVISRTEYTSSSAIARLIDDNGHETRMTYDTVGRTAEVVDAKGNLKRYEYDPNSNVTKLTEIEKSDAGAGDAQFVTRYLHDGLDRRIQTVDTIGNTNRLAYDSRDNITKQTDALGNLTFAEYDGQNRLVATRRVLTDTGDGSGIATGVIITQQVWDDDSRVVQQIDPRGSATTYGYDVLSRQTSTTFADGTKLETSYDVHGNAIRRRDANGSEVRSSYDSLNRLIRRDVSPGPEISNDTTFEIYQYDGLSRLARAEDDDSVVTRNYDSLGRVTSEALNGKTLQSFFDGDGNKLRCVYPGGLEVSRTFDELDRVKSIRGAQEDLAIYSYVGPTRVAARYDRSALAERRNVTEFNYDEARRPVGIRHLGGITLAQIAEESYSWDSMHNRIRRTSGGVGRATAVHTYDYDSAYRLIVSRSRRFGAFVQSVEYSFDFAGNRTITAGGDCGGNYVLSSQVPEPADLQMNQYTQTPCDTRDYDRNGNLVRITSGLATDTERMSYDYANRMISHTRGLLLPARTSYAYDALGRRITRTTGRGQVVRFYYDDWSVVEEQDAGGATIATYVMDPMSHGVLQTQRGNSRVYMLADDLGSVIAVSDASGELLEQYEYSDYGVPVFYDETGRELSQSSLGNPYLFTAHRYDTESLQYYFGARYYEPRAGVFTTRDPLGAWFDPVNAGHARAYVGNNPISRYDALGLVCGSGWNDPLIPDKGPCWDFTWTCFLHDLCYGTCDRSQTECDSAFLANALKSCQPVKGGSGGWDDAAVWAANPYLGQVYSGIKGVSPGKTLCFAHCAAIAQSYYVIMTTANYGGPWYDNAQKNCISKKEAKKKKNMAKACQAMKIMGVPKSVLKEAGCLKK